MELPGHWIMGVTRRSIGERKDMGCFVATLVIESTLAQIDLVPIALAALREYRPEIHTPHYEFEVRYTFGLAGLPDDVRGTPPEWESGNVKIWGIYPVKRREPVTRSSRDFQL